MRPPEPGTPEPEVTAADETGSYLPQQDAARRLRVLVTAAEAYPALERAFLEAETEIHGSFLVFDLSTRLRSDEARKIGRTWFDLVVHVLRRGVAIHFTISDVDGIGRPVMHRAAWKSMRMFSAAAAVAGPGARLVVRAARHPARTGLGIRMLIWPYVVKRLFGVARDLNRLPPELRRAALRDMPDAERLMHFAPDGHVRPRIWHLPDLFPLTHHQKLAVIDRRILYIGGLDLDERRFDTPGHRQNADQTWHDVQVMIEGPVALAAQSHLERFLTSVSDSDEDPPRPPFLRTLSRRRTFAPFRFGPARKTTEIAEAHHALIRRSRRLIYLETQYFRDRKLARALARQAAAEPDLELILIIPAAPEEVAFSRRPGSDSRLGEFLQARCLRIVRKAFGRRHLVLSPAQTRPAPALPPLDEDEDIGTDEHGIAERASLKNAPIVYVHAKVSIFDDSAATVSSANLNGRSLYWDTEAGVLLENREDVTYLRDRVMRHWLPDDAEPEFLNPETLLANWRRLAWSNARLAPQDRRGFLLPHDFAAAERFGLPLPIIPEEMV
ncbi:phospholipase D-like domain-containing protein [Szabonella alba]|uniref:Phospholipase D n=1 Tax=Szabonella alba TaxID=2804194 RepID=A0A8K0XZE8_9RHOB|nr:phospholipase D-like domain-containing protein [Szabonella alba]MBL4915722.1 phospholipase [Szabonella alba]